MRFLIAVTFEPGPDPSPMDEWTTGEVATHMAYYQQVLDELRSRGELVSSTILTAPNDALTVTSDGVNVTTTEGDPNDESNSWIAGFQVVEVDSRDRAIAIAALMSAVPGRNGDATEQPIHVRQLLDQSPSTRDEMIRYMNETENS